MKHSGKIIRMNADYIEGGFGMILIHRKYIPGQDPDNETDFSKVTSLMRTDIIRAVRD